MSKYKKQHITDILLMAWKLRKHSHQFVTICTEIDRIVKRSGKQNVEEEQQMQTSDIFLNKAS